MKDSGLLFSSFGCFLWNRWCSSCLVGVVSSLVLFRVLNRVLVWV